MDEEVSGDEHEKGERWKERKETATTERKSQAHRDHNRDLPPNTPLLSLSRSVSVLDVEEEEEPIATLACIAATKNTSAILSRQIVFVVWLFGG